MCFTRANKPLQVPYYAVAPPAGKQAREAASRVCALHHKAKRCPQMFTGSNDLTHDNFTTFSALSPP
ncbi:hypothetical protein V1277_001809 [Bradyrhizobium sp. AZCC 1588]